MEMKMARCYLKQLLSTLGPGEKYGSFLTALRDFREGKIIDHIVVSRVKELLADHDELIYGFNLFLPDEYKIALKVGSSPPKDQQYSDPDHHKDSTTVELVETDEHDHPKRQQFSDNVLKQIHQATEFLNKVRERCNDDYGVYKPFLDAINRCKKDGEEVNGEIIQLFKNYPEFHIEFTRFQADCYTTVGKERFSGSMGRSKTDGGAGAHYQKCRKKQNPYEAMLFKCEDDQLEVDVLINRLESAIIKMTDFCNVVKEIDAPIDIKRYFTPMDLRCIEQLYGLNEEQGYGWEVIDLLCEKPISTSTRVLNRLIQKMNELEEFHHKAKRVSAKVYKDCHEKILEKQQRSRSLYPKAVTMEEGKNNIAEF